MKELRLPIKKEWLAKILSGEKTTEYREIKPYWNSRLIGKQYDVAVFTCGYKGIKEIVHARDINVPTKTGEYRFRIKEIVRTTEKNDLQLPEVWAIRLGEQFRNSEHLTFDDLIQKLQQNKFDIDVPEYNTLKIYFPGTTLIYYRDEVLFQLNENAQQDICREDVKPEEVLRKAEEIKKRYFPKWK